ncbi:hypothetical protein K443DRAFT_121820 [Laccaria amethystina LaAM-08-1]|uniref:F-box domain-containing protein n=1 Tax=Laccaria amethystina LaAM-08-1 TaxID=1095629 RepID=A0A0C9Y3I6_9AGAR|nr:hypothetical protein K443DRAFT_121820 [Laccaria amethystina LaAM-08-1]
MMAPVRQIPPEVLSQIFWHCLYPTPLEDEYTISKPMERMCRTLSHVCHSWREVAVNDSCLWNNLELDSNNSKDDYKDRSDWRRQTKILLDCSTLCFERAKSRSSSLALWFKSRVYDSPFLADLILPHSKHYRHLNLRVPLPQNFLSLAKPGVEMFGQLESLILVDLDSDPGPRLVKVFRSAPNLCKLSTAMENYSPSLFTLPREQLTHVIMADSISTVMWSIILKQCISIQLGSFSLFRNRWGEAADLCLSLLSLVDLTIVLGGHPFKQVESNIWDAMSLPALRTLRLRFLLTVHVIHARGWDTPSGKYGELLSRIERLSIALCESPSLDVHLRLLRASPGLLELDLQTYNIVELMGHLSCTVGAFPVQALFLALLKSVGL